MAKLELHNESIDQNASIKELRDLMKEIERWRYNEYVNTIKSNKETIDTILGKVKSLKEKEGEIRNGSEYRAVLEGYINKLTTYSNELKKNIEWIETTISFWNPNRMKIKSYVETSNTYLNEAKDIENALKEMEKEINNLKRDQDINDRLNQLEEELKKKEEELKKKEEELELREKKTTTPKKQRSTTPKKQKTTQPNNNQNTKENTSDNKSEIRNEIKNWEKKIRDINKRISELDYEYNKLRDALHNLTKGKSGVDVRVIRKSRKYQDIKDRMDKIKQERNRYIEEKKRFQQQLDDLNRKLINS